MDYGVRDGAAGVVTRCESEREAHRQAKEITDGLSGVYRLYVVREYGGHWHETHVYERSPNGVLNYPFGQRPYAPHNACPTCGREREPLA
jgi:hypothetical protein